MVDGIGTSYLSESDERDIHQAWADGLETDIALAGRRVYFDRNGSVVGPIDVVVEWANREPQSVTGGPVAIVTTEGTLLGRPGELDQVQAGDLFVIDEQTAEIVEPIMVDRGVVRVPFRLQAGGRDA